VNQETVTETEKTETTQTTNEEPTLEDVYRDAGVSTAPEVQQPQAQPQVQPQQASTPQTPQVPDPYDTEAFKAYMARQAQGQTQLQSVLTALAGHLNQIQLKEARAALEADIKTAVEQVNEIVNHPRPKVIEAMIDAKAREDSRFRQLWDNRQKNPEAWSRALKAVGRQITEDFSVKTDPKLVDAQRARKLAQQQMATTAREEPDASWDGLTQEQFNQKWEQLMSGGSN
jgi:hypothetical protein